MIIFMQFIAATNDPNYQTLAVVANNFGADKAVGSPGAAAAAGARPAPPAAGGMAGTDEIRQLRADPTSSSVYVVVRNPSMA